jgi:hypothetical protein
MKETAPPEQRCRPHPGPLSGQNTHLVHANDRAAPTAAGSRCNALIQRLEQADAVHTSSRHLH